MSNTINDNTILTGIKCRDCKNTLPPHTVIQHLDVNNSIHTCPHKLATDADTEESDAYTEINTDTETDTDTDTDGYIEIDTDTDTEDIDAHREITSEEQEKFNKKYLHRQWVNSQIYDLDDDGVPISPLDWRPAP